METSIQLLKYITVFLIQQAKTNRVGFGGVRVRAITQKDMILIRLENTPCSVLAYKYTRKNTSILKLVKLLFPLNYSLPCNVVSIDCADDVNLMLILILTCKLLIGLEQR